MKKLLLGAAGLLLVAGIATAQLVTLTQVPFVGAADMFADIVGGVAQPGQPYASAGQISNTTSVAYSVPLTAFSITQGVGVTWTIIAPAGTLAAGTFTFNPTPTNGSRACIVSTQTQSAITFTGNTGQTVVGAPSALVAGTPACFTYVTSVASWIRS